MSENKFTEHLTRDNAAVVLVDAEDPLHAGAHWRDAMRTWRDRMCARLAASYPRICIEASRCSRRRGRSSKRKRVPVSGSPSRLI